MPLRRVVRIGTVAGLALLASSIGIPGARAAPQLSSDCIAAANQATVKSVRKVERVPGSANQANPQQAATPPNQNNPQPAAAPPSQSESQGPETISLGDMIAVTVTGLLDLKAKCAGVPIVLFLNGYPLKSIRPYPPSPPPAATGPDASNGDLYFLLKVTDGSKATDGTVLNTGADGVNEPWRPILGRPPWPWQTPRTIAVSVGLEDQYPLKVADSAHVPLFYLNILGTKWFLIWGVLFIGMLGVFYWAVPHTNIIRSGNPTVPTSVNGTFSLSKFQGAWWFFVILAAYLLIGIVTGDYLASINGTALILLGIGAGTVIGSEIIDKTRATQDPAKIRGEIEATKQLLDQADQRIAAIDAQLSASPPPPDAVALNRRRQDEDCRRRQVQSNYNKLTGQSEGFLTDILSDADGISFHRFQLAVWTMILGFIFIRGVYDNLAMPIFDTTLMGLLGLSAGTYLGLKIPEATSPKN